MPTSEVVGDGVISLRRSRMPKSDLAGGEGGGEWDGSSRMPESELVGGGMIFLRRAHMPKSDLACGGGGGDWDGSC